MVVQKLEGRYSAQKFSEKFVNYLNNINIYGKIDI